MNYIDIKTTRWDRLYFNDTSDTKKLLEVLENTDYPYDVMTDELGFEEVEEIYDIDSEILDVELYDENDNLIWKQDK